MLVLVLVTYNRLEKLKHALECFDLQTCKPDAIVVVNNHSTDGTLKFLNTWILNDTLYRKHVINTEENIGGSGGFYLGQKWALEMGADWVYVSDDDAFPQLDMIEQFYLYVNSHDCTQISAICSTVMRPDGTFDSSHRNYFVVDNGLFYRRVNPPIDFYERDSFSIDLLSYVGSFLNACALRKVGLVNPDFFIYYDDSEHSFRLKKWGAILCVPSLKVIHDNNEIIMNEESVITWRDYYLLRNQLLMLREHHPIMALNYFRIYLSRIYVYRCEAGNRGHLIRAAVWDAIRGHWGKHEIYKPGWSLLEDN